jgi:hypothetical protein
MEKGHEEGVPVLFRFSWFLSKLKGIMSFQQNRTPDYKKKIQVYKRAWGDLNPRHPG